MSRVQVAAAILENASGEVLIAERPAGKRLAGFWEFPGGKVEPGESPQTALQRELKEELELDVRLFESLGTYTHDYDFGSIELIVYRGEALSSPRPTEDVQRFLWIRPREIDLEHFAPADHAPLRAYLSAR